MATHIQHRIKWRRIHNESFMDSLKSGWKKIKDAFGDLPKVKLVGDDGREEIGYVHDYNKKNQTCDIYLKEKMFENVAAVAAAVAGSLNSGSGERKPRKKYVQRFHKGDEATLVGSQFGDEVPVTILDFTKCADLGIYSIKLEI